MVKKEIVVPKHRCPICIKAKPSLKNHFVISDVHKKPICRECAIALADMTESKTEPVHHLYQRSKSFSGLEFSDFKKTIFNATIEEFRQKLNSPEQERGAIINEERKYTWATKEEVVQNWKRIIDEYTSLLNQLEENK